MGRCFWLAGALAGLVVMSRAQDLSRSSPLVFPDGEMPPLHPYSLPAKPQKDAEDSEWRLPTHVKPIRYNLTLNVNPTIETFSGKVRITFYCTKKTRSVTLHALDLDISQDFPKVYNLYDPSQSYDGLLKPDKEHQTLTLSLDHFLEEGHAYYVDIEFKARFYSGFRGLYRSNYTENGDTKWLAVTHFEPTNARRMFPCFDEPHMKAYFNVTVIHPSDFNALSNAPLRSKEQIGTSPNKLTVSSFYETVQMSTYLLAVVVSQFQNYSGGNNYANIWSRPDYISGAKFSQELAANAIIRLQNYLNITYPMGKIDHIAIPHFDSGAMENYGLITYKEPYLSLQENATTSITKVYTVTVVAHELGHQWFGNLVTLNWWSYTWLNEAFATFIAYHLPGEDKVWRLREQFIPAKYQVGMERDQDPATSLPMSSPVGSPAEISAKFDPISYSKGGAVLKMFEKLLGESQFRNALINYLIKRTHLSAEPKHLFEEFLAVSEESAIPLPPQVDWLRFGESWTAQAGLPVVAIHRNYANGEVMLTQSRFCAGEAAAECGEARWWIPLMWTFEGNKEPGSNSVEWLPGDKNTVAVTFKSGVAADRWILGNVKSVGYFRVNYDGQNWKLLADGLLKNPSVVPTENRVQILHDVLHFALADVDFVPQALNVTLFLQKEDDVIIWMTGVKVLRELYTIVGSTTAYNAFAEYAQKMLKKVYAKVGLANQQKPGDFEDGLTRAYVSPYACMFGMFECLKEARLLIIKILEGSSVNPDIETAVMCGGVQAGEDEIFWKVREKALKSKSPLKDALLASLSCSKDDGLIKEHLRRILTDDSFSKDTISAAIQNVIKSIRTFHIAFNFIKENFQKILDLVGDDAMQELVKTLCTQVYTNEQSTNVQTMLESNKYKIKDAEALKKELKKRSYIVARNKVLAPKISKWLSHETGKPDNPGDNGSDSNGTSAMKPTIFIALLSILVSLYR